MEIVKTVTDHLWGCGKYPAGFTNRSSSRCLDASVRGDLDRYSHFAGPGGRLDNLLGLFQSIHKISICKNLHLKCFIFALYVFQQNCQSSVPKCKVNLDDFIGKQISKRKHVFIF